MQINRNIHSILILLLSVNLFFINCKEEEKHEPFHPWSYSQVSHPESVLVTEDEVFSGDIGKELLPLAKDGDGKLIRLSKSGEVLANPFAPLSGEKPLNSPKGMALLKGILYVADVDSVVGFHAKSGHRVFEANISGAGASFLNDLVALSDGKTILASDTNLGKVFRIDSENGNFRSLPMKPIPGINGLGLDQKKSVLYFNSMGEDSNGVYRMSLEPCLNEDICEIENLKAPPGIYDGIAVLPDGSVLSSNWVEFAPGKGKYIKWIEDHGWSDMEGFSGISGPADFSTDGRVVYYPEMITGKVNAKKL